MAKKKQTNVKSKKKSRIEPEEEAAYKNRTVVEEDEDEDFDAADEVDEVGFEREDKDSDDESL